MPKKSEYELDIAFGKCIKNLRMDLKLSKAEVALHTKIPKARISELESGETIRSVSEKELIKLDQIYSTTTHKLRKIVLKGVSA